MITTLAGTPLLSLDVGGEDHTNGWVFSLTAYGVHNHYFTIVNNQVIAGNNYIPPGRKYIQIQFTNINGISSTAQATIFIKDIGTSIPVGESITLPSVTLPVIGDNYKLQMSWYKDIGNGDVSLIESNGNSHITVMADGSFILNDILNAPVFTSGMQKFAPGRWHTFTITREDRGTGIKSYYQVDDIIDIFESPSNHLLGYENSPIDIGIRSGGIGDFVISNIKLEINNIVYINEEMETSAGIFNSSAGVIFNITKQQI